MGGRVLRISTSSALSKKYCVEVVEVPLRLGLDAHARLLLYLEVMKKRRKECLVDFLLN